MPHFDPYKLDEDARGRPQGRRSTKWTADAKQALDGRERRTGQRRQRRLPDHRQGLRRHRTAASTTRPSPRPTAASICGPRRRCRSGTTPRKAASGTSAPTRAPAGCGTTAPAPRARTRSCWPTSRSASGTASASSRSASASTRLAQRQARRRSRPPGELLGHASCRCRKTGRSSCRRTAARSAGGTSSSARFPPTRPTRSCASATHRASSTSSTARTSPAGPAPMDELRSRGRRHRLQAEEGRQHLHQGRVRRLRRPRRVQAARRRQQRPGDPLSGQGTAVVRRHVRDCRSSTTTRRKYAKLDPRQYNGSAYGMVAAHRGYLRPIGEWNFLEVTVKGPTIKVELNGTRILDADLSKVTEFMGNKPHPGQGPHAGPLRLRRPQRPGRVPQHSDSAHEVIDRLLLSFRHCGANRVGEQVGSENTAKPDRLAAVGTDHYRTHTEKPAQYPGPTLDFVDRC